MEFVLVPAVGLAPARGEGVPRDTLTFQFEGNPLAGIGRHCAIGLPVGKVTDANQPDLT